MEKFLGGLESGSRIAIEATGSWWWVFVIAAILNLIAAVMALVVLKPMRIRAVAKG